MIKLGEYNLLIIDRHTSVGMFLVDEEKTQDVLLPNRYVTDEMYEGEYVEVFVYKDSEDRIIATTEEPKLTLGEFAFLQVVSESGVGAFLDWGLQKDLLVPFKEMDVPMKQGKHYPIHLILDKASERLIGSSKIYRFMKEASPETFEVGDEVEVFVYEETKIGFKVIVENQFRGMLFKNEIFDRIHLGETKKAFIKECREDGKLDLTLQKLGYETIDPISKSILNELKAANGFLPYHDKSHPEEIKRAFKLSKKNFKKAIGKLYKDRMITIESDGIRLV
jgi:predicted RNA-binding protein (virulence factor B family)